jgi:hypothetical protein
MHVIRIGRPSPHAADITLIQRVRFENSSSPHFGNAGQFIRCAQKRSRTSGRGFVDSCRLAFGNDLDAKSATPLPRLRERNPLAAVGVSGPEALPSQPATRIPRGRDLAWTRRTLNNWGESLCNRGETAEVGPQLDGAQRISDRDPIVAQKKPPRVVFDRSQRSQPEV